MWEAISFQNMLFCEGMLKILAQVRKRKFPDQFPQAFMNLREGMCQDFSNFQQCYLSRDYDFGFGGL